MRLLFVKQTNDGWPTKVIFEDIKWQTLMCNILLKHLDEMLYKTFSRRISDYGFPKDEKDYTELSYIVSKNIKKIINRLVFFSMLFNFLFYFHLIIKFI